MRILMDVDGVLADFVGHVLAALNLAFVNAPKEHELGPRHMFDYMTPKQREWCEEYLQNPGVARNMEPYPEARDLVVNAQRHHEVFFVTSPWLSPTWCHDRLSWLRDHFGIRPDRVLFARAKHLVDGDVLIEDYPLHVAEWKTARGEGVGLLVRRHWNATSPMPAFTLAQLAEADFWDNPDAGRMDVRRWVARKLGGARGQA